MLIGLAVYLGGTKFGRPMRFNYQRIINEILISDPPDP